MSSIKELMGKSSSELRTLAKQLGVSPTTNEGKGSIVQKIMRQQAEQFTQTYLDDINTSYDELDTLAPATPEIEDVDAYDMTGSLATEAILAQQLYDSGFARSFKLHSKGMNEWDRISTAPFRKLGLDYEKILKHIPNRLGEQRYYSLEATQSYIDNILTNSIRDDALSPLKEGSEHTVKLEYQTSFGTPDIAYRSLASLYLKRDSGSPEEYGRHLDRLSIRLQKILPNQFKNIGFSSAMGNPLSYMDALPVLGDKELLKGIDEKWHRDPLTFSGNLYTGGDLRATKIPRYRRYSLIASLTNSPYVDPTEEQKEIQEHLTSNIKSLVNLYKSGTMQPFESKLSNYDVLLGEATKYTDIEKARAGYHMLDDPEKSLTSENLRSIIENEYETVIDPHEKWIDHTNTQIIVPETKQQSIERIGKFVSGDRYKREPTHSPQYPKSPEAPIDNILNPPSHITYHDLKQGSEEWHAFRNEYDISGSNIGQILGRSKYNTPLKSMLEKLGIGISGAPDAATQAMFSRGHRREEEARRRVSQEVGASIHQVGAITNKQYPNLMYSPDGLLTHPEYGEMLWEHKNPERSGRFADLLAGDHPDYMDQVQLGMLLSDKQNTLFSQTIGQETRNQVIPRDPNWYNKNKYKIDSTLGRMHVAREALTQNASQQEVQEALSGEKGLWKSSRVTKSGPGSPSDEFLNIKSSFDANLSVAVKEGILKAREEIRKVERVESNSGNYRPSTDSVNEMMFGRGDLPAVRRQNWTFGGPPRLGYTGGSGGSGGGGGRWGGLGFPDDMFPDNMKGSGVWGAFTNYVSKGVDLASARDRFLEGVRGGSLQSASSGAFDALSKLGPIGKGVQVAGGLVGIAAEATEYFNDFQGNALDVGSTSPFGYAAQNQALEMYGLNEGQAKTATAITNSAYSGMANAEFSKASRIVIGTRGTLTYGDIAEAEGDSSKLLEIFRQRTKGMSQARIAGMAESAGLPGFARASVVTDKVAGSASSLVDKESIHYFDTEKVLEANQLRTEFLPRYMLPRGAHDLLSTILPSTEEEKEREAPLRNRLSKLGEVDKSRATGFINATSNLESNNNMYAKNPNSSALGSMQVLDATARKPGFGIAPAKNQTPQEYDRVGREYAVALYQYYKGDIEKAGAAYTDGIGTVDKAIKKYGDDWLKHVPKQAQKRVESLGRMGLTQRYKTHSNNIGIFDKTEINLGNGITATDSGFGYMFDVSEFQRNQSKGQSRGQGKEQAKVEVNLNINAQINDKEAKATVTTNGEKSITQTINMNSGALRKH